LVIAWNGTKSKIDAVGAIDRDERERELDQFFLAELRSRERKDVVRDVALSKQRQGLRPGKPVLSLCPRRERVALDVPVVGHGHSCLERRQRPGTVLTDFPPLW
jgi:hypothetical protein